MSVAQLSRLMAARLARPTWILALALLAGCAYEDGYYGPSNGYGYFYDHHYGHNYSRHHHRRYPCRSSYDCDDWRHPIRIQ